MQHFTWQRVRDTIKISPQYFHELKDGSHNELIKRSVANQTGRRSKSKKWERDGVINQ